MNIRLALILSLSILVIAENEKRIEDGSQVSGWEEAKDVYTVVDETNQINFGLPIGTELKLDRKTRLYKPPKLFANFTADDRMQLQWIDQLTRKTYCKAGPGNLKSDKFLYNYYWHTWCRDSDGESLCCNSRVCNCNVLNFNCVCEKKET